MSKPSTQNATPTRRSFPSPSASALYVMQNEFGLIKVGRSVDPEARRRNLQTTEQCRIELVFTLPGEGDREEVVHYALRKHHLDGEWFQGDDRARAAVARQVKHGCVLDWPFELDEAGGTAWVNEFLRWRDERSVRRKFARYMERLITARSADMRDSTIWHLHCLSEFGQDGMSHHRRGVRGVTLWGQRPGECDLILVPRYTATVRSAMELWPDDARPNGWEGTPMECCLAALSERRRRLPRGIASRMAIESRGLVASQSEI